MEQVSFLIDTQETGTLPDAQLEAMAQDAFPLTPQGIIDGLELRRLVYAPMAAYGHFGREDLDLPWERTDRGGRLRAGSSMPGVAGWDAERESAEVGA